MNRITDLELIARFMNLESTGNPVNWKRSEPKEDGATYWMTSENLPYDSDWNWFVEPCRIFRAFLLKDYNSVQDYNRFVELKCVLDGAIASCDLEYAFPILVDCITWYNSII